MKQVWVYDLETLNIFTATFIAKDSDECRVFILTDNTNEIPELLNFLRNEVSGLIGFNCLTFDAQVLEYIFRNPNAIAENIRQYALIITNNESNRIPDVPEWKLRIPHLDLFRALSLSVKAKRTGLKWTEFMMDMDNIEDMPSQGQGDNWIEQVKSYNKNDVIATKMLFQRYKYEIDLRNQLTIKEKVNLINSTEPDMARKLFAKYLSKAMGIPENDLKTMSTHRDIVNVKEILFPYITFKTELFQQVKTFFEKLSLKETDGADLTVNFQGLNIEFGLGGIHASVKNKIVESDENYIIKSLDVVSYYPNLAIKNGICAEHLPKDIFLNLYEGFFKERQSIPKSDPRNYILKILLNSAYGLSNDQYSFLRDRKVTLSICINGQLLLTQLMENIATNIPDSQLVMMNTDGFEVRIPREYETVYYQICQEWEKLTQLKLEYVDYSKMVIFDVNNYMSLSTEGKVKLKGKCEYKDIPLHKNKSHSIIPLAFYEYMINGKAVEDTIKNHRNIFDFCAGVKAKKSEQSGQSWFELRYINGSEEKRIKLSKTVRYYISKKGEYLFKCYPNSIEHVEAPTKRGRFKKDWKVTYFNRAYYPVDFEQYGIDYQYYIIKVKDWIELFEDKNQLDLFATI